MYSYQALMLFRLAREAPVAMPLSRAVFQYLQSSLVMIPTGRATRTIFP
jgi:hypothetical protein